MLTGKIITLNHIAALLLLFVTQNAFAEEWKLLLGLRGAWKFEIGDNSRWSKPGFDDRDWESIAVPSAWEDEGFPGYDGYAWYRKHFKLSSNLQGRTLAIHLGAIDDVDEVYLNGHFIGSTGKFPPNYSSAYFANRIYSFPADYLNQQGDNVIAIRVYDQELSGGILRGSPGIYEDRDAIKVDLPFTAEWKFRPGDDDEWKDTYYNDSGWRKINVPSFWEGQGYSDYDGFGWYRITFRIPSHLAKQRLILLLGKIDDFDETFLNGVKIGRTGSMASRHNEIPGSDAYQRPRAYTIPPGNLNSNGVNVLAVRVYDGFQDGGIYAGPIGITTKEKYLQWQERDKRKNNIFEWLFK